MNVGIFPRLTAGYLVVLFLLGASNLYTILRLIEFNTLTLKSYREDLSLLEYEKRITDAIFSQRRSEQKYLLTKDAALYKQFLAAKEDFEKFLAKIDTLSTVPAQKDSLDKIIRQYQRYQFLVNTEMQYLNDHRNYDRAWYTEEKEKASDAMLQELEELEEYSREEFYNKVRMVSEAGASARNVAAISFLLTVLLVVLLAFLITRSITTPLMKLVRKTRDIQSGAFACDLDVSAPPEIAELTEAFNRMCERLKEVDIIKADFFAGISHELRTPLTTITEGTSLLIEGTCGSTTDKQNRLLTIIAAESNRLVHLVNSILDLSKMEAGMMPYRFEKASIEPLIQQAVNEITPYAEAKRIHMEKQISLDLPAHQMDVERILDVLRNLLGNAVKFTPEDGRITVAANTGIGGLEVSVSDSGPGIPEEKLMAIFEKYQSSDQKKGTGLGLAIVRQIVAAHGGKVWAENAPGGGAKFFFVLPS